MAHKEQVVVRQRGDPADHERLLANIKKYISLRTAVRSKVINDWNLTLYRGPSPVESEGNLIVLEYSVVAESSREMTTKPDSKLLVSMNKLKNHTVLVLAAKGQKELLDECTRLFGQPL
jgi:hypothetical protein